MLFSIVLKEEKRKQKCCEGICDLPKKASDYVFCDFVILDVLLGSNESWNQTSRNEGLVPCCESRLRIVQAD